MIEVRVLRDGREVTDVALADLGAVRAQPGTLVWVDAASPTPEELAALGREFGIHEVTLEDLEVDERQRPKIEQYDDQVVLVFYAALPAADGRPTRLVEVDLVAGPNYLLTFHGGSPVDPDPVARRVKARPELVSEGAGYLLYVAWTSWSTPSSRPLTPSASGSSRSRRRSWPATPMSRPTSSASARS